MTAYIDVNGQQALSAHVYVPGVGAWGANVAFDGTVPSLTGRVTLTIGTTRFVGTIVPQFSGSWALARSIRIVAGGAGWAKEIPEKHFHNDALVSLSTVLSDAAAACGEQVSIGTNRKLLNTYVRRKGAAQRAFALLGESWWVDYDGVTQVRARASSEAKDYDLLNFNSAANIAELGLENVGAVVIGSVLRGRLDAPLTVRSLEILITHESSRMQVWGTT